jgi:hypothetical protein
MLKEEIMGVILSAMVAGVGIFILYAHIQTEPNYWHAEPCRHAENFDNPICLDLNYRNGTQYNSVELMNCYPGVKGENK